MALTPEQIQALDAEMFGAQKPKSGLTQEQIQALDATMLGSTQQSQPPAMQQAAPQEKPSWFNEALMKAGERSLRADEATNMPDYILRQAGAGAGLANAVANKAVGAASEAATKGVGGYLNFILPENAVLGAASGIDAVGNAAKAGWGMLPQGVQDAPANVAKWYGGLSQDTRDRLEALGNIPMAAANITGATQLGGLAARGVGSVAEQSGLAGAARQAAKRAPDVQDMVMPVLNKQTREKLIGTGRVEVKKGFGGKKYTYTPDKYEKSIVEAAMDVPAVDPRKTVLENRNAIAKASMAENQALDRALLEHGGRVDKNALLQRIRNDAARTQSVYTTGEVSETINIIAKRAEQIISQADGSVYSIHKARQELDDFVKSLIKEKQLFGDGISNAKKATLTGVKNISDGLRNILNETVDRTASTIPVAASRERQALLLRAEENLREKAGADWGEALHPRPNKWKTIGVNAAKLGVGAGIASAVPAAFFSPWYAAALAAPAGLWAGAKGVQGMGALVRGAASPELRIGLGRALQGKGKLPPAAYKPIINSAKPPVQIAGLLEAPAAPPIVPPRAWEYTRPQPLALPPPEPPKPPLMLPAPSGAPKYAAYSVDSKGAARGLQQYEVDAQRSALREMGYDIGNGNAVDPIAYAQKHKITRELNDYLDAKQRAEMVAKRKGTEEAYRIKAEQERLRKARMQRNNTKLEEYDSNDTPSIGKIIRTKLKKEK
jgi:hypothetical protein